MSELLMEIERKYLIKRPDAALLAKLPERTEIYQTYLQEKGDGFSTRIRKRGTPDSGYAYTLTRKKTVAMGERIELEKEISARQYAQLLLSADPCRKTVEKERYCFDFKGQRFEMDIYSFSTGLATLEIELPSIETRVELPDFLEIIEDVTEKPGYTNYELSVDLRFPD